MKIRSLIPALVLLMATGAPAANRPDPGAAGAKLKLYESSYYNVYTDLDEQDVKETLIRMTKMADEYHERTKDLFRGTIDQKLPFYLFSRKEDYYAAGGMPGSAGVFAGDVLMSMTLRNREGRVGLGTWHVVQHEGFHQFVHYVIRGDVPTWANEGLAEYFGEGVFTGDSMVTGLIPGYRLRVVQASIRAKSFKSIREIMLIKQGDWNKEMSHTNYDQAWSMVHFLAHAENGKYQEALATFLVLVGKGSPWDKAWLEAFGGTETFEEKWKEYWLKMPENPTLDLYTKAVVSTFTSFLGRAYSRKQTFDSYDEFIKTDPTAFKASTADWLPPGLFIEMRGAAERMKAQGFVFTFARAGGALPQIQCVMKDGTKLTGTFTLKANGIGKVTVLETNKAAASTKTAT